VESEPGKGSIFHFTASFDIRPSRSLELSRPETLDLQGIRVLVVDDNSTNRRVLKEILTNWQMVPEVVGSGMAAIKTLKSVKDMGMSFALMLLDIQMPHMDGFELAEYIKGDPELHEIKIIALTSIGQREDMIRCRELNVSECLTKPIKQSDLLNSIMKTLGANMIEYDAVDKPKDMSEQISQNSLRILLAEDNAINQKLATHILEKRGHNVAVAANGYEALDMLEKQTFDLILMDVQMPKMDGFEATAAIREKEENTNTHIPIIAMTAYAMKGDREKCLNAGMDGYVSKPIKADELHEAIKSMFPDDLDKPNTESNELQIDKIIDKSEVLDRVDGDMELLSDMVELFVEDCPNLLSEIKDAVNRNDSKALERSAHTLKGAVANFAAETPFEAALNLENMGRNSDLEHAEKAFNILEQEIKRLELAIKALVK
jgi:CheY-like chemotaxis protein